ncbi:restriction endonuclease [Xenorhabdus stockiae]|uniref:restriction endonuclease n=1 Tax=Xenorhabdus stockiae TaxID=351614 RepID=UPI003CF1A12A
MASKGKTQASIVVFWFGVVATAVATKGAKEEILKNVVLFTLIYWIGFLVLKILWYFVDIALRYRSKKIRVQDARRNLEVFLFRLDEYLPILARKKRFLITTDDYGYISTDKWESEKRNFLKKFNYQPCVTKHYRGLIDDEYNFSLDAAVDDYLNKNPVIEWNDRMSPAEYEGYCADILKSSGWQARTTSISGDQGVDVVAEKDGLCVAIQCKKYSSPVGNKAVQEVTAGMAYWGASIGVVVTNAGYTRSARELATVHGIFLLHHEDLGNLEDIIQQ